MRQLYYAGIGSRSTPVEVQAVMLKMSRELENRKYILRSGGAAGADTAFENGCAHPDHKMIYRPRDIDIFPAGALAMDVAKELHPKWDALSPYVRKLMGRSVFQVLGSDLLTPSRFVLCWTPDGCEHHITRSSKTGGTGLAISVASSHNIPVVNMANPTWKARFKEIFYS